MLGWSGIAAVIAVNVVIAAYVVMAWNEDKDDRAEQAQTRAQIPQVGNPDTAAGYLSPTRRAVALDPKRVD
jgi:hypothetical protein